MLAPASPRRSFPSGDPAPPNQRFGGVGVQLNNGGRRGEREINNEGMRGIFTAEREEMACSGANCAGLTVTETSIPPAKCLNFNYCFPPSEQSESDEATLLRQKLLACETANGALPSSHICPALSLDQLPLGAARRCPASSPPSPRSRERRRWRRSCVRSPPRTCSDLQLPLRGRRSASSPPAQSPKLREDG